MGRPRLNRQCSRASCWKPHRAHGLCAMHLAREVRKPVVLERLVFPYQPWRFSKSRASVTLHAPAKIRTREGWSYVAVCSKNIKLSPRRVWKNPRTSEAPTLCGACTHKMRQWL